jgi:hypothetical protein
VNLSCAESEPALLTNTSDGFLHLYEYNKSNELEFVKKIELQNMLKNYLSQNSQMNKSTSSDANSPILCTGLHLFTIENKASLTDSQNKNLIGCVATSSYIFIIDLNAANLIYLIDFKNMPFDAQSLNVEYLLPQVVDFSLVGQKQINAAMHSLFKNEIQVIQCSGLFLNESVVNGEGGRQSSLASSEVCLSVVPR